MSTLLNANNLCKSYGAQTVLNGVTLTLTAGEKVGLVGINGGGKSTLARILAGVEVADTGDISRRRGLVTRYLAQEPSLDPGRTALETVLSGMEAWSNAKARYEAVSEELARGPEDADALVALQGELAAEVERLGGWEMDHRAESIMQKLGVSAPSQPVGTMSGGEKRRVALAALLVAEPELAILDEPTNHLDAESIEWLEEYLSSTFRGAVLLVTHDRYVLDRVAQRTLELDRGQLYDYPGGWETYLVAKAERQAAEARTEANRQNFLRRELEWLRRQPKARTTKSKSRIDRAEAAQSQAAPPGEQAVKLKVHASRLGNTIVEFENLMVELGGRRLIDGLDLKLTKGERLGILGKNGTGKTTLLRVLMGELTPTAGRVVIGHRTQFAYFDQTRAGLHDEKSIVENVAGDSRTVDFAGHSITVFSYLERFLFSGDKLRQPVGSLSGGERARVVLAKLLLGTANVLLLDEPTNDLDVATLSSLEETLAEFPGVVVVVTHDRYFLDRLVTSTLVFEEGGRVTRYPGGYSHYKELRQALDAQQRAEEKAHRAEAPGESNSGRSQPQKKGSPTKGGLSQKEKQELDGLLERITVAETKVAELELRLGAPETHSQGGEAVKALLTELELEKGQVERLLSRWEELELKRGSPA